MLDPFPIPPPHFLLSATKPLSDTLHLHTLPLHAHEILFAAALYTLTEKFFSPWISNLLTPQTYARLSRKARLNWNVHIVSFVQSCLINSLSLWVIWCDSERAGWRDGGVGSEGWEGRVWGYYGSGGLCQSFALGYFLWDLYMCSMNIDIFGWGMLAHAISAVAVFALGYRPFIYFSAPIFLLYELSSPFLNVHWFCDKLNLTGSIYQAINGVFLVTTFFSCRIVWGLYNSYFVFRDIYGAIQAGHTNFSLRVPTGQLDVYTPRQLQAIAKSEQGQLYAFNQEKYTPLWIPAIYLASNLILNSLNIFWFGKMIETIRTRFDPPWGTKGAEADKRKEVKDEKGSTDGSGRARRHSIAQLNPEGGTVEEEIDTMQEGTAEAADALTAVASSPAALASDGDAAKKGGGSVSAARARAEEAMNGPIGTVQDTKMAGGGGGGDRLGEAAEDGDVNFGLATGASGDAAKKSVRSRRKA